VSIVGSAAVVHLGRVCCNWWTRRASPTTIMAAAFGIAPETALFAYNDRRGASRLPDLECDDLLAALTSGEPATGVIELIPLGAA
jgi:hypothetical protein